MRLSISMITRSKVGCCALQVLFSWVACPAQAAEPTEAGQPPKVGIRGEVTPRGYLGVTVTEICPEVRAQTTLKDGEGLMIGRVDPDSPAATLGLLHYDILTRFNDQWLMSPAQFATLVENAGPGMEVEITYLRRGEATKTKVRLGRSPAKPLTMESLPLLPEEMLTMVIRALRENPVLLENIHRMLHGSPAGAGESGIKRGAKLTKLDAQGMVELKTIGEEQHVRVWDRAGKLLFEGPCYTREHLAAMTVDVRSRVETMLTHCKQSQQTLSPAESNPMRPAATVLPEEKDPESPKAP